LQYYLKLPKKLFFSRQNSTAAASTSILPAPARLFQPADPAAFLPARPRGSGPPRTGKKGADCPGLPKFFLAPARTIARTMGKNAKPGRIFRTISRIYPTEPIRAPADGRPVAGGEKRKKNGRRVDILADNSLNLTPN
jgi:hypothetical protein